MSWQTCVSFAKTTYSIIRESVHTLVGDDVWLQLLAIVFTAVVGGVLFGVVGLAADRLVERNAAMSTRALYGVLRFVVLYPLLVFTILAVADGYMGGKPGTGVPVACGILTAFACARHRNRRNWSRTKSKG